MSAIRIVSVLLTLSALIVVLLLLRRRQIREKYAALWLVLAIVVVVLAAVPNLSFWLADRLGIQSPSNLVLVGSVAVLFLLSVQLSVEIGRLESESRALAEEVAILRLDVEQLSQAASGHHDTDTSP